MLSRYCLHLVMLLAACLALASCDSGAMAPPPGMSPQVKGYAVEKHGEEGWEQSFSFGSFVLEQRPAGRGKPGDWAFLGLKTFQPASVYTFNLREEVGSGWACRCALGAVNIQPQINIPGLVPIDRVGEGSARLILGCEFQLSLRTTWRMSLSSNGEGWELSGLLSDGAQTSIRVLASQELAGQSTMSKPPLSRPLQTWRQFQESAAGYAFELSGKNLGGVRVAGEQTVWLPPGKLRAPVACASAALLMLRDLKIPRSK